MFDVFHAKKASKEVSDLKPFPLAYCLYYVVTKERRSVCTMFLSSGTYLDNDHPWPELLLDVLTNVVMNTELIPFLASGLQKTWKEPLSHTVVLCQNQHLDTVGCERKVLVGGVCGRWLGRSQDPYGKWHSAGLVHTVLSSSSLDKSSASWWVHWKSADLCRESLAYYVLASHLLQVWVLLLELTWTLGWNNSFSQFIC